MSESFDPYLNWLGIRDPERPPNHYRLLGLDLFEDNPDVIATAADRQMAHVRTFQNGEYADLSQKLLNELAVAKICLLKEERKVAYDEKLREASGSWSGSGGGGTSAAVVEAPPVARPAAATPVFSGIETDSPPANGARAKTARKPASTASGARTFPWMWLAAGAAAAVVVVLVMVLAMRGDPNGSGDPSTAKADATEKVAAEASTDGSHSKKPGETSGGNTTGNGGSSGDSNDDRAPSIPPPGGQGQKPETGENSGPGDSGESNDADTGANAGGNGTDPPDPVDQPAPWERARPSEPPAQRPAARLSVSDAFAKLHRSAHAALRQRRIEEAMSLLPQLRAAASAPDEMDEADRLEEVAFPLQDFWNAVDRAVEQLTPDAEVAFGDSGATVTVVRRDASSVQARAATGAEREFATSRANMDPVFAVGLAQGALSERGPRGLAAVAAFEAIDKDGVLAEAEKLAREAQSRAVPVSGLLAEVSTDYSDLTAAASSGEPPVETADHREPTPADEEQLKQLRDQLPESYPRFSSRDPKAQAEVAGELLSDAMAAKDSTVRFVLLLETQKKAEAAGELDLAISAIERLEKQYRVDGQILRGRMLKNLTEDRTLPQETAVQATELATRLARQTAQAEDFRMAGAFAKLAGQLAAKSRNADLRKQAGELADQIQTQEKEFGEYQAALKTLETDPGDAQANLAAGRYLAFAQDKFEKGLPYLAKGAESDLAAAARLDLAGADTGEGHKKIGDAWVTASENRRAPAAHVSTMVARAKQWYQRALSDPNLNVIAKRAIERQLEELEKATGEEEGPSRPPRDSRKLEDILVEGKWSLRALSTDQSYVMVIDGITFRPDGAGTYPAHRYYARGGAVTQRPAFDFIWKADRQRVTIQFVKSGNLNLGVLDDGKIAIEGRSFVDGQPRTVYMGQLTRPDAAPPLPPAYRGG